MEKKLKALRVPWLCEKELNASIPNVKVKKIYIDVCSWAPPFEHTLTKSQYAFLTNCVQQDPQQQDPDHEDPNTTGRGGQAAVGGRMR